MIDLALALILVLAACGGVAATTTSGAAGGACVNAKAAHHAYVVVEHISRKTVQRCVGFDGNSLAGVTMMKQSGIEYQSATTSFGLAVCQIDNEPRQFAECLPKNQPYWSLWLDSGGAWQSAQVGISEIQVHDHEALGWRYVSASDPSPSPPPSPKGT
ncbi:MAG: hypothetical protein M3024_07125 [Candidatus Dormibacteraeota bacterium]|nr:hypothetical protein [Candidatus Dormibacteraeota bacterium]